MYIIPHPLEPGTHLQVSRVVRDHFRLIEFWQPTDCLKEYDAEFRRVHFKLMCGALHSEFFASDPALYEELCEWLRPRCFPEGAEPETAAGFDDALFKLLLED